MHLLSHYLSCKFIAQLTVVSGWIWGRSQKCNCKWYGDRDRGWIDLLVTKRQTTVSQREPSELDYVMLFSCWGFKLCRHLLTFFFPVALSSSFLSKGMLEVLGFILPLDL